MFNPYKKKLEINKALATQIKETGLAAQLCLNDEKFISYRERFLKLRQALVQEMLTYSNPDHMAFALEMSTYQTKIQTLGLLLGSVQDDANVIKGELSNTSPDGADKPQK